HLLADRIGADAFDGGHLGLAHGCDGGHTGTDGRPVDMDGAGTALCDTTAELRPLQAQLVAQHPEQRHLAVHVHRAVFAVHRDRKGSHGYISPHSLGRGKRSRSRVAVCSPGPNWPPIDLLSFVDGEGLLFASHPSRRTPAAARHPPPAQAPEPADRWPLTCAAASGGSRRNVKAAPSPSAARASRVTWKSTSVGTSFSPPSTVLRLSRMTEQETASALVTWMTTFQSTEALPIWSLGTSAKAMEPSAENRIERNMPLA